MFYSHEGANRAVPISNRGELFLAKLHFQSSSYIAQVRGGYSVVGFLQRLEKDLGDAP